MDLAEGKQQEELVQCVSSKVLQRRTTMKPPYGDPVLVESLTISNIRNGQNLASSKFPFLWKLHEMLNDCEKTGDDHIVSWMEEGRSFRVHKPKSFMEKIVPHYFKQSKFKSFQRQLHLYDFVRTPRGIFAGAYAHPLFIRGDKSLCLSLSPHKIKGDGKESRHLKTMALEPPQQICIKEILPFPRKRTRTDGDCDYIDDSEAEGPRNAKRTSSYTPPDHSGMKLTDSNAHISWSAIEGMLVTGASLAAELTAKEQKNPRVPLTSGTTPVKVPCPHTGDVVYAFDDKPFRFIDDVCNEESEEEEDDDVMDGILMDALEKDEVMDMLTGALDARSSECC